MKNLIIPTVFAISKKEFYSRFNKLKPLAKFIQIDFMDGKFVKEKSIKIKDIPNLSAYKNNFEAHLMIKNPEKQISKLKEKGFSKAIFHIEALKNRNKTMKLIAEINKSKMKSFIALNPETNINKVLFYIPCINGILLMGHKPGLENISLVHSIYKKIKSLRLINKNIQIQIDGGVNDKNIKKLVKSGANIFNIGSFVADADNPRKNLAKLSSIVS